MAVLLVMVTITLHGNISLGLVSVNTFHLTRNEIYYISQELVSNSMKSFTCGKHITQYGASCN